MKRLKVIGFINPIWFNGLSYEEIGIVTENNTVNVKGTELSFTEKDEMISAGDEVWVYKRDFFYYMTKEEKGKLEQQKEKERIKKREKENKHLDQMREEAEAFNLSLGIPIDWVSEIKPVLSGLTENSNGDGAYKKSVYHVLLKENIEEGRFKRKAGDFLCTTATQHNGHFSDLRDKEEGCYGLDSKDKRYKRKVTCKSCIKTAARWKKEGKSE